MFDDIIFNTQHACETIIVGEAKLTTFTTEDREQAERESKNPYEYAAMLRNSARFNPTMGILKDCADMIEFLADELCNSDYTFENGQSFQNKYAKSWQK